MLPVDVSGLPGYSPRPYAGGADHRAMALLLNRWNETIGVASRTTTEQIDTSYAHLDNCNPETDMVMVEAPDDSLAAYVRVEWAHVPGEPTRYWVVPHLDPAHRTTGLWHALAEAAIERCTEIAGHHEVPSGRVLEGFSDKNNEPDICRAYEELGFHVATFGAEMSRSLEGELPSRTLPEGLEIRPVTDEQLRQIWEADQEAFRDHWGWSEPTENDYERFLEDPHRDVSLWRIAWDGEQVAGQVKSFINHEENDALGKKRGWTEYISTGRRWRKRGVASALIAASLRALRDAGMTEAALGVHAENPTGAFRLYESLGFEVESEWLTWHKPI